MEQQIVHLFVFNTLSDWEPAFAIAGINNPAFQTQPGRFRVQTVGESKEPITTVGGITILPDMTLDALEPSQSALLILPGGADWETGRYSAAVEKAKAFLAAGVPVAAICGATAGLAYAGVLNERHHTSNTVEFLKTLDGYRGEALYHDEPAVIANNLITAGATASLEFAYQIFKRLKVYDSRTLEAWYNLYKTGDRKYFYALTQNAVTSNT